MDMMNFAKKYGVPAAIIMLILVFGTPTLSSWLGPSLGTATSYVVTLVLVIVALWFNEKTKISSHI